MGAKNHAIVMPDASMDATVNALVAAGFGAAGQRCMALSTVVFVGGSKSWENELVELAKTLKVNAGTEPDADLGPVISKQVHGQVTTKVFVDIESTIKPPYLFETSNKILKSKVSLIIQGNKIAWMIQKRNPNKARGFIRFDRNLFANKHVQALHSKEGCILSHMSEKGMKSLVAQGKLPLKSTTFGMCENCIIRKQKNVSFLKGGRMPKSVKLKLVHTNLWEPSPITSLGGSQSRIFF